MRFSAYNRCGVLMGTSWRASGPRWPRLRTDSLPMITLFPSQGDFCATAAGGLTDPCALGATFVHPGVDELVQPAELARPAGRQGRELFPRLNGFAPPLQHLGDVARGVGIGPHLIHVPGAVVPAAQGVHKRCWIHDLSLLRHDQVPPAGELLQRGVLCECGAYGRTLLQVCVGIDVDDLIERTELGVPEGP